jgi:hypothetical protein
MPSGHKYTNFHRYIGVGENQQAPKARDYLFQWIFTDMSVFTILSFSVNSLIFNESSHFQ